MKSVLLPTHIKPERYEIFLKPDLKGFVFHGEETIWLNIRQPTKEITLHSKNLKIKSAGLKISNTQYPISKKIQDAKSETITFKFVRQIPKGKGRLKIKFKGILSDKLKGFYRSKYTVDGREKYMATTQFEATDARAAFPCFDEPRQKAVFDVTLMIPSKMTAISNTIEESVVYEPHPGSLSLGEGNNIAEHEGGYKTVKFAPTPKMSTYLLAFIVGDFEFIEKKSKRGVLVRIFVTPGKKHQASFALETAIKVLDFYEEYFDIPYPLPVLDLIAIPDFASAAMENWGAITYRETALLVDDQNTSSANKQWVAIVIAHELAHQWFGNLVTMHWWTDLWLNEGFASYMEYMAVDKLFPKWRMWGQYVSERFAAALKLDALENTHPIEIEVRHPDEIWEIFDSVSYAKGSAVIRMLAGFLGEKDFRRGLRYYLKKYSYGNTKTDDLWRAFEKASGKPIIKMMRSWTRQAGHPVVFAKQQKAGLVLSQRRFFSSEISGKKNRDKTLWQIPVTAVSAEGKTIAKLLGKRDAVFPIRSASWIKLNFGERGVFRTQYSPELFAKLELAVKNRELEPSDRLGIARDAFSLSQAGQFLTEDALALARYYKRETELSVWEEIASGLSGVYNLFQGEKWAGRLRAYCRDIFRAEADKIGWEPKKGESHTTVLKRSLLLGQMGIYNDKKVIKRAKRLFFQAQKGRPVPVDLRGIVYPLVAANGGEKEFYRLIKMYKDSGHHEEKDRIGRCLGYFKNKKILSKAINFALGGYVRAQDSPGIFIQIARNYYGRDLAWKYLTKNWISIEARYNSGGHLLEWFVSGFSVFTSGKKANEIEQFFQNNPTPALKRTIAQVVERIQSNQAWLKREEKNVKEWINGLLNNPRVQTKNG